MDSDDLVNYQVRGDRDRRFSDRREGERRSRIERRAGLDRRWSDDPDYDGPERRFGDDRRVLGDRRNGTRRSGINRRSGNDRRAET